MFFLFLIDDYDSFESSSCPIVKKLTFGNLQYLRILQLNNMENIKDFLNQRIIILLGNDILKNVIVDSIIVMQGVDKDENSQELIWEAKTIFKPIPGAKHYTNRIDPQLGEGGPGRQRHIHVLYNGKELLAMNADGTAHDGYHQVRIPDEVIPFLKSKGFPIPPNNIIEMVVLSDNIKSLICEKVDYVALNEFYLDVGEILRKIEVISIIESNVETYQILGHSKVLGKYDFLEQLDNIPQCSISKIKRELIEQLRELGKQCDTFDILEGDFTKPHRLYVVWKEL